jgi:hypothetical protein
MNKIKDLISHFHNLLSDFRKGYGCQTTLLKIIEDWKNALDQNKFVAAILWIYLMRSTAYQRSHLKRFK